MAEADWIKTQGMVERLIGSGEILFIDGEPYHEDETGKRRHIIHRDTEIDGGVYLGGREREAVVVDSEYNSIPKLYEEAKEEAREYARDTGSDLGVFTRLATFETVRDSIDYDEDAVESINEEHGVANDGKIAIDMYLSEGVGKCRHKALATGAVLEQFQKDGYLEGDISVDRNQIYGEGGHAWVRYESPEGNVQIIDPTQDVFAPLEMTRDERWDYGRPDDNI